MPHDAEIRRLVEQACVEYERDLRAFLNGVLRDSHVADDAYQRTVIRAIEAAANVNPDTIRGWLFQIALNEGRELKRQMARQGRLKQGIRNSFTSDREIDDKTGLVHLLSREEQQAVRQALSRLDADYREVVIRRIQKGQTFAVIASEMNRPLGTILTWMRRALLQLREMQELRSLYSEPESP